MKIPAGKCDGPKCFYTHGWGQSHLHADSDFLAYSSVGASYTLMHCNSVVCILVG